jgi:hypothetical protein
MSSIGGYSIFAPWGDTFIASMTGTGAALMGAESVDWMHRSASQSPEPLPFYQMAMAADDVGNTTRRQDALDGGLGWCRTKCRIITPPVSILAPFTPDPEKFDKCVSECPGAPPATPGVTKSREEAVNKSLVARYLPIALGAGIVLIGAAAIVRG